MPTRIEYDKIVERALCAYQGYEATTDWRWLLRISDKGLESIFELQKWLDFERPMNLVV
jgi:hypothetical protein